MKLYYTVASQPEDIQPKPSLSLGGFKSASLVPNSVIGNLFSDISMYSVKNNNANNYIALILTNDGLYEAIDILIWFAYPTGCVSIMKVDAIDLATDTDGNKYMEHVPNFTSKPLYATFEAAAEVGNAVNIGDLAVGSSLGLWIERTLDLATLRTQQNAIYTPDAVDTYRYVEVVLPKEDLISIGLSWDEAPTTALAGVDQSKVNNGSFTLAGNVAVKGVGGWSVVSGTATITNSTLYNSGVTGVPVGTTAVLKWTITSGNLSSSDNVSLINTNP